jgi:hypothetical protein
VRASGGLIAAWGPSARRRATSTPTSEGRSSSASKGDVVSPAKHPTVAANKTGPSVAELSDLGCRKQRHLHFSMLPSEMVRLNLIKKGGTIAREKPTRARFGALAPASERVSPVQTVQPPANGITWP